MRPVFAAKLGLKKILGQRPHVPWRAIACIATEPLPPLAMSSPCHKVEHTEDGLVKLAFGASEIWYPEKASLAYIGCEHAALRDPNHPHFYEKYGTIVNKGDVVLDCGACEGFFAQSVVGRSGQVHLFEPVPILARCLRKTFAEFFEKQVFVWEFAVSDRESTSRLTLDTGDYQGAALIDPLPSPAGNTVDVKTTTIDAFVRNQNLARVDYIKIDVEGADLGVLHGAASTLRTFLPKVAVASYHQPEHALRMMAFMRSLSPNYKTAFAGTSHAWRDCRPLMAHFWV